MFINNLPCSRYGNTSVNKDKYPCPCEAHTPVRFLTPSCSRWRDSRSVGHKVAREGCMKEMKLKLASEDDARKNSRENTRAPRWKGMECCVTWKEVSRGIQSGNHRIDPIKGPRRQFQNSYLWIKKHWLKILGQRSNMAKDLFREGKSGCRLQQQDVKSLEPTDWIRLLQKDRNLGDF